MQELDSSWMCVLSKILRVQNGRAYVQIQEQEQPLQMFCRQQNMLQTSVYIKPASSSVHGTSRHKKTGQAC